MKKAILLFTSLLTFALANGQFKKDGQVVTGNTFTETTQVLNEEIYVHELYFVNSTGAELTVKFGRIKTAINDTICTESLCFGGDLGLCLNINPTIEEWDSGSGKAVIPAGDSTRIDYKAIACDENTCMTTRVYILDETGATKLDSVNVELQWGDCALNIEESIEASKVSVYPNPANDVVNFNVSLNGVNTADLFIVDMLGKQVYTNRISNGNLEVNTSSFRPGVYFYSIRANGKTIETKKLVVKH